MASVFTKIINRDIPSYKIAENDNYYAFLDIQPLVKGHVLVVPKKETDYIFDLDDQTLSGLMTFAKSVAKKMDKVLECKRIGVSVIGLEVPHAHVHLIPINGVTDMDFGKEKLSLESEEMEKIAKLIREA
ncbi:MAG: HIT family protein [Brumimicrobium sp.]